MYPCFVLFTSQKGCSPAITWACLLELSCLFPFFFLLPCGYFGYFVFASPFPLWPSYFMLFHLLLLLASPQVLGVIGQAASVGKEIATPVCIPSPLHSTVPAVSPAWPCNPPTWSPFGSAIFSLSQVITSLLTWAFPW